MRDWWSARRTKEEASGGMCRGSIVVVGVGRGCEKCEKVVVERWKKSCAVGVALRSLASLESYHT